MPGQSTESLKERVASFDAPFVLFGPTPSTRSSTAPSARWRASLGIFGRHLFGHSADRVGPAYTAVQQELWVHAGIRVHTGKTKVWNRVGIRPVVCDVLERIARTENPHATVWTGSDIPSHQQGVKILGTPLGHSDFVAAHLRRVSAEHQDLLQRIPSVADVQSAWLLLLHCAAARACFQLRVVGPSAVEEFARHHDQSLWQCLSDILQADLDQCTEEVREAATLPLSLGGLGLRSAMRMSEPAYWASWADCLPMFRARHPEIADEFLHELEGGTEAPCLAEAAQAARNLVGVMGFEPPTWHALARGARPPPPNPEDFEQGFRTGWQHEASSRVERSHRDTQLFPRMGEASRALIRSQAGPGAGLAFSTCPTCRVTALESNVFRMILLRRLQMPLPLTVRTCRCGRPLDAYGHHRAQWRTWQPASVVKREVESQPTHSCEIWTSICHKEVVAGDWKLSSTGCLCWEAPSWRWTQHSSAHSMVMAPPEDELLTKMGSFLPLPEEPRKPVTPSWWALVPGRGLSCWASKLAGDGLAKPSDLCVCWPEQRPGPRFGCCDAELNRHGAFGGAPFFLARSLEQWRNLSWNFLALQELMGTCRLFMRWSALLLAFCEKV